MAERVSRLRNIQERKVDEISGALDDILHRRENALADAAFKQVSETISVWLKDAHALSVRIRNVYEPLVDMIATKGVYASSVRASVNRSGDWYNFDYYFQLSAGARRFSVNMFNQLVLELYALIDNMEKQTDLHYARKFLRQLRENVKSRSEEIYEAAAYQGRNAYQDDLISDQELWRNLKSKWGQGPGYKLRVSKDTDKWFYSDNPDQKRRSIEIELSDKWRYLLSEIESMLEFE